MPQRLLLAALVMQALAASAQAPEWDRGGLHSRGDVPRPCAGETGRFLDYCLIRERFFPMTPALPERWPETYTSVIVGRRDDPDGCGVFYFVLWIEGPVLRKVEVESSVGSLWTSVIDNNAPSDSEGPLASPGTGELKREIPVTAGVEKLQSLVKDLLEG